jgi:hypothetical protein
VALRIGVAVVLLGLAGLVAWWLDRRQSARPAGPVRTGHAVPHQLDRSDFARPEAPWLVVVFSSASCNTCAAMITKAAVVESPPVAFAECQYPRDQALHERYHIDAVPTTVIADDAGVVRAAFVGQATATDLWAALAEVREPGSSPEPGLGNLTDL